MRVGHHFGRRNPTSMWPLAPLLPPTGDRPDCETVGAWYMEMPIHKSADSAQVSGGRIDSSRCLLLPKIGLSWLPLQRRIRVVLGLSGMGLVPGNPLPTAASVLVAVVVCSERSPCDAATHVSWDRIGRCECVPLVCSPARRAVG